MNKLIIIIVTIILATTPFSAFAIYNCEVKVDTSWLNYKPCVVMKTGDKNSDFTAYNEEMASYKEYFNECTISNIASNINSNNNCNVAGWNTVLFFREKPSQNINNDIENYWKSNFNGDNFSKTKITATNEIGGNNNPRKVIMAGYNILIPVNNGDNDICIGDPNDDGPCSEDANEPWMNFNSMLCPSFALTLSTEFPKNNNGGMAPFHNGSATCIEAWWLKVISNNFDVNFWFKYNKDPLASIQYGYKIDHPTSPYNLLSNDVTLLAGDRTSYSDEKPSGSFSQIEIEMADANDEAFVINKGSILTLRDLKIVLKKGSLATIQSGGELRLSNVVIQIAYDDIKKIPASAIKIENGGKLFLRDPDDKYSNTGKEFESDELLGNPPKDDITKRERSGISFFKIKNPSNSPIQQKKGFSYIELTNINNVILEKYKQAGSVDNIEWWMPKTDASPFFPIIGNNVSKTCFIKYEPDGQCYDDQDIFFNPGKDCLFIHTDKQISYVSKDYTIPKFADQSIENDFLTCNNATYRFMRRCPNDKPFMIKGAQGLMTCEKMPENGNAWKYDKTTMSFICPVDATTTNDGGCYHACNYGMEFSEAKKACVCKAGSEEFSFRYGDGESTICRKSCGENKQNKTDMMPETTDAAKISIYDICVCVPGMTEIGGKCVDTPAEEADCDAKTTAHGKWVYSSTNNTCKLECDNMFKNIDNACHIKCDKNGMVAASDGDSCICDTVNNWVPDGLDCKCRDGYVKQGNICVEDDPVECSEDSDCDDDELCDGGKCVDKDKPKKGFGEACEENSECNSLKGLACFSGNCYCDTDNNWAINTVTGNSCVKGEPEDDEGTKCKVNGGTYIKKELYCEFNATIAACKVTGGTWNDTDKSCSNGGGGGGGVKSGSGCGNISNASLPNGIGNLLPFLMVLGFLWSFPRKRESH